MKTGTKIDHSGTSTIITPRNGKKFELEELQAHVGGYIQIVARIGRKNMYADEEGRLKALPFNATASDMAGQEIVGTVIIV